LDKKTLKKVTKQHPSNHSEYFSNCQATPWEWHRKSKHFSKCWWI